MANQDPAPKVAADFPPMLSETVFAPDDRGQIAELGKQATDLIQNPAFKQAVARLERSYIGRWRMTGADPKVPNGDQVAARERLYVSLTVLQELQDQLQLLIQEGKVVGGALSRR